MKSWILILLFLSSIMFPVSDIFAPPPPDQQQAFDYSEHVIIGKILSVEILSEPYVQVTANTGSTVAGVALYEVQVEKYLKNPLDTSIIKVPGYYVGDEHVRSGFDLLYEDGEKVFLYIQPDSNDVLSDYYFIIRSYESRSLDRMGPICDKPDTFYHKGKCIIHEPEPEGITGDVCGPTVLANSDICNHSLSPIPLIIILVFLLIVGLLAYLIILGDRK